MTMTNEEKREMNEMVIAPYARAISGRMNPEQEEETNDRFDRRTVDDETNYEIYKSGEDVYLECYCHPLRCHGDVIVEKLQKRLLREKIKEYKNKKNEMG